MIKYDISAAEKEPDVISTQPASHPFGNVAAISEELFGNHENFVMIDKIEARRGSFTGKYRVLVTEHTEYPDGREKDRAVRIGSRFGSFTLEEVKKLRNMHEITYNEIARGRRDSDEVAEMSPRARRIFFRDNLGQFLAGARFQPQIISTLEASIYPGLASLPTLPSCKDAERTDFITVSKIEARRGRLSGKYNAVIFEYTDYTSGGEKTRKFKVGSFTREQVEKLRDMSGTEFQSILDGDKGWKDLPKMSRRARKTLYRNNLGKFLEGASPSQ
jgi:hypothetical protein